MVLIDNLPKTDELSEKLCNENRISIMKEFQRNNKNTNKRLLHLEVLVIGYKLTRVCYVSTNYHIFTKSDLPFLELLVFVLVL